MSKRKRHRNGGVLGSFVAIPNFLRQSPAWRTLKPVGRAALVEIIGIYNGGNNGWLAMSARTLAAAINVSRATAARALKELTERGFIEQTRPSAFSCKVRLASEWRLTFHPCDRTKEIASRAFMRWQPENRYEAPSGKHNHMGAPPRIDSAAPLPKGEKC
jgi:IclR helix-turn-helix domain